MSIKKVRRNLASSESLTVDCGYGIIIVSSSSIGKTCVSVKDAHSIVALSDVPNILVESLSEYSFRVTNRASISASMDVTIIGYVG